jgi:anaerobic selenocysteine-containing dehydrogenase
MTNLPVGGALRLNRYDFDRLGVAEGDLVRVIAPALTIEAPVVVDPAVPRGSAGAWFNQDGLCAADLIDITAPLTVLQVESLSGQGAGS